MEIIKTYIEEIIGIILVITIGTCAIILTTQFSLDEREKSCVEFYKKTNYILEECEIYKEKLMKINKGE